MSTHTSLSYSDALAVWVNYQRSQMKIEDYATTRQLRSSYKNLLAVPYVKTDTAARAAFRVSAPTIWNSLPTLVKSSSTLVTFKRHLKTFLRVYRRAFDWPLILRASELSYWQITARYKFTDWLIDWLIDLATSYSRSSAIFSCHRCVITDVIRPVSAPGTERWRLRQAQTATKPNHFHTAAGIDHRVGALQDRGRGNYCPPKFV